MEVNVIRRSDKLWEMTIDGKLLLDGTTGDAVTFTKSERVGFIYGQDNALTRVVLFLEREVHEQRHSNERRYSSAHEFGTRHPPRHENCRSTVKRGGSDRLPS